MIKNKNILPWGDEGEEEMTHNYEFLGYPEDYEKHPFAEAILKYVRKDPVLDVGCGNGNLLVLLKDKFDVEGFDSSEIAVKMARKKGLKVKVAKIENFKTKKKFKTILLMDLLVLSHNPKKDLERVCEWLDKEGVIMATIPNASSPKNWFSKKTKHHIYFPSHFKFRHFLKKNNFKTIKCIGRFNLFPILNSVNLYIIKPVGDEKMIPVCKPWLPGNEKKYVLDALDTNWISGIGSYIKKFEESFAKFCGVKYAKCCCSGYASLHLACVTLGLKEGDEVIVPTFTMIACTNAIIMTGAKPVLVDSDRETYCIDPEKIEEKITPRTKAIMVVHIYGHPCDMDKIINIARKYNLKVIEDCAEAHGTEYKGKKVGGFGDIGCFSFYSNKILTTGEGGMCTTNNQEIDNEIKKLRDHYLKSGSGLPDKFIHNKVGFSYSMTNLQAGIGTAQVENAEMLVNARRNVGIRYDKQLKDIKGLILPIEKEYAKNIYWMYGVVLSDEIKITKEEVMEKLKEKGIETRSFFVPMHKQPAYINKTVKNAPDYNGRFPVAEKIGERGFYLPSSSNLTDEEIKQVCDALKEILKEGK